MRAISKCTSMELRHKHHTGRQKDGFIQLGDLLEKQSMKDLFATQGEVRQIIRGDGGNHKLRGVEIGVMEGRTTVAVRASQWHSAASGVADDILPVAEVVATFAHGATLEAALSIAHEGISKAGRVHVHFYESDLEGRPSMCTPPVEMSSGVIIVVSAERCGRFGLDSYKAADGAILTPGLRGFSPASCVLCVRQFPTYKVLWSALSKQWGSTSAPFLGPCFGEREGGRDIVARWFSRLGNANHRVPDNKTGCLRMRRYQRPMPIRKIYIRWRLPAGERKEGAKSGRETYLRIY